MEEVERTLEILGKLASDDEFRSAFERDPAGTLKEYGINVPADSVASLPPKEVLASALNTFAAQTLQPQGFGGYGRLPPWTGPFPLPWDFPWRLPPWTGPFPLPWGWGR